jgi:alpha-L-glutamate ligase-like protein
MWFFKKYWLLGQNERNLKYINEYNDEYAKRLADSKLKTKEFLQTKWVNVSTTLLVIRDHEELHHLDLDSIEIPFVIKPNSGYWWKWILIIDKKDENWNFITNDNDSYSKDKLIHHIKDILDWFYSLSWSRDKALFEKKIILDSTIELLWKYGLPDIRVIVFNMVPVMAMLRVPTSNSKWKANLHAGACWVWIDIWTWKLTYITQFRKIIKSIPWIWDIRNIEIPYWDDVLKLSLRVAEATNIKYLGCDIVLDDKIWPLLLEVNVRPWLEVQVANLHAIWDRLKKVQNVRVNSVEKWVRLWKDLFGWDIEGKIKNISWKKVLWNREYIEVYPPASPIDKGDPEWGFKCISDIKTSKPTSYMDINYLENILKYPRDKVKNDIVRLKCNILWEVRNVKFIVKKLERVNVVLGKEALYWFLVDPFKYKDNDLPFDLKNPLIKEKNTVILKSYEEQLLRIDRELMDIDKKLNILRLITPKNQQSERLKFINSEGNYIPQLEYNELNFNLKEFYERISKTEIPEIPLSHIFLRKKEEIIDKLYFLEAFKNQNVKDLNKYSKSLYWEITKENLEYAKNVLLSKNEIKKEVEFLTVDEIKEYVEKFNHIYWINIELREKEIVSRFQMVWNILYLKHWSNVWKREIRSIIAHEIEWHYLRKHNWMKQKYSIFSKWTSHYIEIEEGLATYNQSIFLTTKDEKYYYNAERYYFMWYALENNYPKLINELKLYYNNDYEKIFRYIVRFKRWLKDFSKDYVFLKDIVYLNWYLMINNFIKNWWNIKELYFWKITFDDIDYIKKSDLIDFKAEDLKIPLFF